MLSQPPSPIRTRLGFQPAPRIFLITGPRNLRQYLSAGAGRSFLPRYQMSLPQRARLTGQFPFSYVHAATNVSGNFTVNFYPYYLYNLYLNATADGLNNVVGGTPIQASQLVSTGLSELNLSLRSLLSTWTNNYPTYTVANKLSATWDL